ncbi:MAG: M14 family metallopeptidase [Bacteroidota bacterium]
MKAEKLVGTLLILFFIQPIFAQNILLPERFAFEPDLVYDSSIPSPAQYHGYELGEALTLYHQMVAYFRVLGQASSRITLGEYGETYEGRPLIYLVISSEENHSRLETLRQKNLERMNGGNDNSISLSPDAPMVVSFSYNIHGNEASTAEAAMQVAYRLAAAQDAETESLLNDVVFVMYPCINPDGRDRYSYWYKSMRRAVPATEFMELEHDATWPNGRTNHYWFDLNRDWIWGVHPESRGHISIYQQWMPQVHVDYHEQGINSNYFTAPGTTPRNMLLPDTYEAWSDTFGRANIAAFDKHKIAYFTRESFDFFYPGYGSSYPSVMGAIGMLVEQGGIGGGRAVETDDGQILTLRQRVFDHYTTSIASLKKAVERKSALISYAREAMDPASSKVATQAYILPDDPSGYLYEVLHILLQHGVEIQKSTSEFTVANAQNYRDNSLGRQSFPVGTYIISTDQSRHLFINTVMQQFMEIEDSVMYDMSTWSAPLAFNLEAFAVNQALSISTEPLQEAPKLPQGITNPEAEYAYVIDWNQRYAPRALAMLWKMRYRVRSAEKAFGIGDQKFSPGSLIILLGRNLEKAATVVADMEQLASDAQVQVVGLNTGRMDTGIDLVSRSSNVVKPPKVALMVDQPFDTYTAGQLYFLFDQDTRLPVARLRPTQLQQTDVPKFGRRYGYGDLNDYDVLLLPGANNLSALFGEKGLEALEDWIRRGGVLIATEESADFFTKKQSELTAVELDRPGKDTSSLAKYLPYQERQRYYGLKRIPGSALNAHIDTGHPLGFGIKDQVYALKFGSTGLKPSTNFQTVGYYEKDADKLLSAGYASSENLKHLAGKSWAGVVNMGQGKVVLITDNTQYRMFWRGPSRMIQNAVMLLPGM